MAECMRMGMVLNGGMWLKMCLKEKRIRSKLHLIVRPERACVIPMTSKISQSMADGSVKSV